MDWKPGDRAIIVGATCQPKFIGMTCEILSLSDSVFPDSFQVNVNGVRPLNGRYFLIYPKHLRRIDDDDDEVSWENIEKLTGWKPKVLERIKEAAP